MIYIYIILCCVLYLVLPHESLLNMGVSQAHWTGCLTYPLSHASWLHLIVNMLSLALMYRPICKVWEQKYNSRSYYLLPLAYSGAVLSGIICAHDIPTVGASGIVFFLLGLLIILNPTKRQALNYIWLIPMVAVQIYTGKSNIALHLVAFCLGALSVIIKEAFNRLNEYRGIHTN